MDAKVMNALDNAKRINFARCSAFVILRNGDDAGKIKIAYPKDGAGLLRVFVWDYEHDVQMGTAGGYGYDKVAAALRGLKFGKITLEDSGRGWEGQLRDAGYTVIRAC